MNWTRIAYLVILFVIIAAILLAIFGSASGAASKAGGGGSCNLYCAIKDAAGALETGAFPQMCGC